MNYLDLIIIYLACGSPFAVYYFFNQRQFQKAIWLRTSLIALVWIPYAFKLLRSMVTDKLIIDNNLEKNEKLYKLQKQFEEFIPNEKTEISLFEFREVIERYTELTLISSEMNSVPAYHEQELFRVNGNQNIDIQAICLNRRNYKRLLSHQTQASRDFVNSLKILLKANSDKKKLGEHSIEFVRILNDENSLTTIIDLFSQNMQTVNTLPVKDLEKEIWKTMPEQKQLNEKPISMPLQTMTLTANGQKKD